MIIGGYMLASQVLKMCNMFQVRGEYAIHKVFINGKEIYPDFSICPDGFTWGPSYKKCCLLAIIIVKELTGDFRAAQSYNKLFYHTYLENNVRDGNFEFTFVYQDWVQLLEKEKQRDYL